MAKWLIYTGILLTLAGVIWYFFSDKLNFIGKLPGDIRIEKENFTFYFPITTMILLSVIINILIRILKAFQN
ncbi:MAG: DUF2905 domain-containing protein [Saprospiraceae bacterium]|jgi:hypothetical protein|nr:DUF2905 domain-containing protein [Saprospiraceae bacterium]